MLSFLSLVMFLESRLKCLYLCSLGIRVWIFLNSSLTRINSWVPVIENYATYFPGKSLVWGVRCEGYLVIRAVVLRTLTFWTFGKFRQHVEPIFLFFPFFSWTKPAFFSRISSYRFLYLGTYFGWDSMPVTGEKN